MIRDIYPDRASTPFKGVFRVCQPHWRKTQKGADFLVTNLVDVSGGITAYGWDGKYDGPRDLVDLERVEIVATSRIFNGTTICDIMSVERSDSGNPLDLIPSTFTLNQDLVHSLSRLIDMLAIPALRDFVEGVMNDDRLFLPFLQVPGSARHHHCEPTGLFRHSIECATMVSNMLDLHGPERELAIVAALFHDIGKVRCFDVTGKRSITGYVMDHDNLTLEMLAHHLAVLDEVWPDGGVALRYLLTWKQGNRKFSVPLLTVAEAITSADRLSSGLDRERQTFRDTPKWRRFVRTSPSTLYWRPRMVSNC